MSLLSMILPIYILIFLGYWLRRTDRVTFEGVKTLKFLLLNVALPCLLFHGLVTADMSDVEITQPYLLYYGLLLVTFVIVVVLAKTQLKLQTAEASVMGIASTFSNNIYIGIPILMQLYGESIIPMYFALLLFHAFVTVLPCYAVLEMSKSDHWLRSMGGVFVRLLLSPVISSLFLALIFRQTEWVLPSFVDLSLKSLSAMAMPVALILLGAEFHGFSLRGSVLHAVIIAGINNVILPLVGLVIGKYMMGMTGTTLQLIVILFAIPMGLMPYLIATQYNVYLRRTMSGFFLSNLFAPFTMLGIFWLLGLN